MTRLYGPPASRILYYIRGGISFSRFCGVGGGDCSDFIAQILHAVLTVTNVADGHFGRCCFGTGHVSRRRIVRPGSSRLSVLRRANLVNLICKFLQYEPTRCTIYFQFISIIKIYMFRADTVHHQEVLLCIYNKWYKSCVYVDWLLAGSGSRQQPVNV
jgi:hypothetical protein